MKFFFEQMIKIFSSKWTILTPPQKKFLIYDEESTFILYKIVNKSECEILHTRYEKMNFYILFLTFIRSGFRNFKIQYMINFIKFVSPEFVITSIDNDSSFYKLKNIYPNPRYISIQNGMRAPHVYYNLFENNSSFTDSFNVDYLFVFGEGIKKRILKNYKFNIIVGGSVLNNHYIHNYDQNKKNNSVLFISQCKERVYDYTSEYHKNRTKKKYKNVEKNIIIPEDEKIIFNILYNFCKKKKLELSILPKSALEKHYRKHFVSGNWKYINKNNYNKEEMRASSYLLINKFNMIVFLYSTLGYEALSRGIKCACFPYGCLDDGWVKKNRLKPAMPFGYPDDNENVGPFWSNMRNDQIVEETLEKVFGYSNEEWTDIIKGKFVTNTMHYDPGNSIINQIINKN